LKLVITLLRGNEAVSRKRKIKMSVKTKQAALIILIWLGAASVCSAAETGKEQPYRLELRDGSSLVGYVTTEDADSISFTTISGSNFTVARSQIERLEKLSGKVMNGQYHRSDPNYTRLLFSPTARALKSGTGYISMYQLFFPFVAVGVADIVTLAGGISLLPGAEEQLLYFAPKITLLNHEYTSVAAGLIHFSITGGGEEGVGIYYGVATFGNSDAALTCGLGWGYAGEETADKPVVLIGGEYRLSNSLKLVSENWLVPDSDVVPISFGFRFFGENLATDIGFINLAGADMGGWPFIPWVNFVYNFGGSDK
jgi:hypothetical protein